MKLYLSLFGHANQTSLPLRFGIFLTEKHQCFCDLENASYDEEATKSQRMNEIEKGRKHYIGSLTFNSPDKTKRLGPYQCRVVLEPPSTSDQSPRVVTVMSDGDVKGDMTVTRHIEGMLKRNQINRTDLIDVFHPAYAAGEIKDSNDCERLWRDKVQGSVAELEINDQRNQSIKASLCSEESNYDEVMAVDDIEDTELKAPLTYKKMVIPHVENEYVMADAYIDSVRKEGNQIVLSFINSKGHLQEMRSFPLAGHLLHLAPLHDFAFEYLTGRQEQRAKLAICMSPRYRGVFAESVTAIALQLSRSGGVNS